MHIALLSTLACLLAAVAAQSGSTSNPPTTPPGFTVTAGKSSTFTWTPTTSGTVTLTLRNGDARNLNKGIVLVSGIPNSGSHDFTVPEGTASGAYTIEISSDSNANDANYSDNITVEGSGSVGTASSSASALTTTTTASSSSSSSSTTSSTVTSTTPTRSETSITSHTSASSSGSSSSTSSTTKSTSSPSGTSAPTSSTSTPTGSSKGASAGTALGVNDVLLAVAFGILVVL